MPPAPAMPVMAAAKPPTLTTVPAIPRDSARMDFSPRVVALTSDDESPRRLTVRLVNVGI